MSDFDDLGNRMKSYESTFDSTIPNFLPLIIRLDGKSFSTLAKKIRLKKPFDEKFHQYMVKTAIKLCSTISSSRFAYTQSDEISILVYPKYVVTQPWHGNRIQKIVSVAAGLASNYFTWCAKSMLLDHCYDDNNKEYTTWPVFDARTFCLPVHEVQNYFWWRQKDAIRNSISAFGQANYSCRELEGISTEDLKTKLLIEKNLNWDDQPEWMRWGSGIEYQSYELKSGVERHRWNAATSLPKFVGTKLFEPMLATPTMPDANKSNL